MQKESLKIAQDRVYGLVEDPRIPTVDKVELLINLISFLNPEEYEDNIKVLKKEREKNK